MNDVLTRLDPTARTLRAGDLTAVFLPALGMLGASLTLNGQELLGRVGDIASYAQSGRTCGIPFLHPWANRLSGTTYTAAGQEVSLNSSAALIGHDGAGLPMHGVPWSRLSWQVMAETVNSLRAGLDWTSDELLAVFPYPHRVETDVRLTPDALTIETLLMAGSSGSVPSSFGYHPYFQIPQTERAAWHITAPAMGRLVLDAHQIPTGETEPFAGLETELGTNTFDDGFALTHSPAVFSIAGNITKITLEFLEGYTYAQIFAPKDQQYIALEPMTAPANALSSGNGLSLIEPGGLFRAKFRIGIKVLPGGH